MNNFKLIKEVMIGDPYPEEERNVYLQLLFNGEYYKLKSSCKELEKLNWISKKFKNKIEWETYHPSPLSSYCLRQGIDIDLNKIMWKLDDEIISEQPEENKKNNGLITDDPHDIIEELQLESIDNLKEKSIEKLDTKAGWDILKKASKKYYHAHNTFRFFISKEKKLKGKITNKEFENLQQISILKESIIETEATTEHKLSFFDEKVDKRTAGHIVDSFDVEFWVYKFRSDNREYIILSQEELDLEEYTLEGTQIHLTDYADVGKYSKLSLKIPIIILHTAKKRIIKFKTDEEFFKQVQKLKLNNEDNLRKFIFSQEGTYYQSPKLYEDLVMSWLFSGKKKGYPLHLMIIGDAGSGKSTTTESLYEKSSENVGIFEGTTSTFKELIPSFKTSSPKVGYMLESNRFCFCDEFLRVLMRVDKDDRTNQLTFLNTLLEHKKRRMGSGNCSFEGNMTSKMMAVTNPVFGTKQMTSLVHKFEESITFLSRILIFYQDKEHIKFVNKLKEDEGNLQKGFELDLSNFLAVYDYLMSKDIKINNDRLKKVFNKIQSYLSYREDYSLIKDMFDARYYHHLQCLLDGIVKRRSLMNCENFIIKEKDYLELEKLTKLVLESWGVEIIDNKVVK